MENIYKETHPLRIAIQAIELKMKWAKFAYEYSHPRYTNTAIQQIRKASYYDLYVEHTDLMVQYAEHLKLVSILVSNQIEFEIINGQIHLL